MATKIILDDIPEEDREFLSEALTLQECGKEIFVVEGNDAYFPKAYIEQEMYDVHFVGKEMEKRPSMVFVGKLRDQQHQLADAALKKSVALISAQPGFGKTITGIYLACQRQVQTLIIVNKLILIDQWVQSLNKFAPSIKVEIMTSKTVHVDPEIDVYVVNAINMSKKTSDFFSPFETVIVDELHQILSPKGVINLLKVVPSFLLGLSATPYRFDEYNKCVDWFFGKDRLEVKVARRFEVELIETGFVPKIQTTWQGKLDWNAVLTSQAENEKRNRIIVESCKKYPDRNWLILVKRVTHADNLKELFAVEGIEAETLMRSKIDFDREKKILIGTTAKIGVGFDHAKINALLIAADVKNFFVQFLGRCTRDPSVVPLVVDLIDKFGPLKKHQEERSKDYK